MLSRLLEIVLLELLRTPTALPDERQRGMLAGLADPRIAAALRAFHADIRHAWSVSSLAILAIDSYIRIAAAGEEAITSPCPE
jgi:hypothetical protein